MGVYAFVCECSSDAKTEIFCPFLLRVLRNNVNWNQLIFLDNCRVNQGSALINQLVL